MPHTLLLADDSATIQRVIEMTFAEEDVRVAAVGNGREAIERIAADPPDIVLADTNMPEKDGYAVSAFVKADSALSHIPVVLLTGAFDPVDGDRAREVGCDAVLVKPFEPQAVITRVRELLGAPAVPETGTPASAGPPAPAPRGDAPDRAGEDTGRSAAAPASPPPPAEPERPREAEAPAVADGTLGAAGGDGGDRANRPDPAPAASAPAESPAPAAEAGDSAPPVPAVAAVEAPPPPSLADAFASLLAAEQGDPRSGACGLSLASPGRPGQRGRPDRAGGRAGRPAPVGRRDRRAGVRSGRQGGGAPGARPDRPHQAGLSAARRIHRRVSGIDFRPGMSTCRPPDRRRRAPRRPAGGLIHE